MRGRNRRSLRRQRKAARSEQNERDREARGKERDRDREAERRARERDRDLQEKERGAEREESERVRKLDLELLVAASAKKEARVPSIFAVKPQAVFPKFGDKNFDVEEHLESFEDLCNLANPTDGVQPAEKLRLFGTTLEGSRLRSYKAIVKQAERWI